MRHAKFLSTALGLASLAVPQTATAAPTSSPVPGITAAGDSIARAGDGTMWLTEPAAPGRVARVAADGTVTEYTGGVTANFTANRAPDDLAVTPDGYVWFLMHGGTSEVARIATATGTVYRYLLNAGTPTSIAAGPDGKLWITAKGDGNGTDFISRYTVADLTTKVFTSGLTASTEPRSMVAGSDGAMWFVEEGGDGRIGRLAPSDGAVTYRSVGGTPTTLGIGPGGALWFASDTSLGRIGTDTTDLFATDAKPAALAAGPDDALWGTTTGGVVRVTANGEITTFDAGLDPSAKGTGIAAGPDGRMWMTLDRSPGLVRITVPPRVGEPTATVTAPTAASVSADVRPNGVATTAEVQLAGPNGQWTTLSQTAVGDGIADVPVKFDLNGLPASRALTARVLATSAAGSVISAPTAFVTPALTNSAPEPTTPSEPVPATTPPSIEPTATPAPVQGATVVVRADRGTVRYRVPGSTEYRDVDGAASIPTSSIIDTTSGSIVLSSQVAGREQLGTFSGGEFKVKQVKATGMTQLYLTAPLDCAPATARTAAKAAAKKKRRHIWGKDSGGRYETHGKDSVATVRGTKWLTTDTCAGTVVKVYEGAVSVKPRKGPGKAVLVTAGGRQFTPSVR